MTRRFCSRASKWTMWTSSRGACTAPSRDHWASRASSSRKKSKFLRKKKKKKRMKMATKRKAAQMSFKSPAVYVDISEGGKGFASTFQSTNFAERGCGMSERDSFDT